MIDPHALLDHYAREREVSNCGCSETARGDAAARVFDALRVILDIHKPHDGLAGTGQQWCLTCWEPTGARIWPCPTILAITSRLEHP